MSTFREYLGDDRIDEGLFNQLADTLTLGSKVKKL